MDVVFGITGQTGSATANALLETGHPVRALVRDPGKAAAWAARGVELVQGDLHDADAVAAVLQGARGAYVLVPPQWGVPDLFAANEPVVDALVRGVEAADVPRVVLLSSIGAEQPAGTGPIRTLRPLEAAWRDRPGVTFLRAAYFQENLGGSLEPARADGVLPVFVDPEVPIEMVATADIGREAARLLSETSAARIVQLAGPEPVRFEAVAGVLSEQLGRAVATHRLPPEAITPILEEQGAGHYAVLYAEMNAALDEGRLAFSAELPLVRGNTTVAATLGSLVQGARAAG